MICGATGKICYPNAQAANKAVGEFRRQRRHQKQGKNESFYCEHCAGYHLGHNRDAKFRIKRMRK